MGVLANTISRRQQEENGLHNEIGKMGIQRVTNGNNECGTNVPTEYGGNVEQFIVEEMHHIY